MIIRQLKLINSKHEMVDLLDKDIFGFSPEGLGVVFENDYQSNRISHIPSQRSIELNEFELQVMFGYLSQNPYLEYHNFTMFLNHSPYILEYETEAGLWRRDCQLNELSKSEMNTYGVMAESLKLDFLTPWYVTRKASNVDIISQDNDGKIYNDYTINALNEYEGKVMPYSYDYTYHDTRDVSTSGHGYVYDYVYEGWINGKDGRFILTNDSVYMGVRKTSPITVTIHGPCVNPYWEVTKHSETLESDGYDLTLLEGYKLVVSSVPGNQYAKIVAPNGKETNVYQNQRLDLTNFVHIPLGASQISFFNCDKVDIEYREERVVV